MRRFAAIWVVLCLLLTACHQRGNEIVLEGDFQGGGSQMVRLALVGTDETVMLDSVRMKNGHFSFALKAHSDQEKECMATPMLYQIKLSENNALTTIAKGGEHLHFTADAADIVSTYRVSGSEEAFLVCQLDSALASFAQRAVQWYAVYEQNIENDSVRADVEAHYVQAVEAHTDFLRDFIQKHPHNMASFMAFFQSYNRRIFLNNDENAGLLKEIIRNVQQQYPDNPYILFMQQKQEILELKKQQYDTH